MALIYIDRLIQRNNFLLTELNVHRVIVTAILLAAKFFDDAYYNNAYYAKVGGVLVSEMNGLEVDFLFRINFSLHVTPETFEQYRVELLSHLGSESLTLPAQLQPQLTMEQQQQLIASIEQHRPLLQQQHQQHQIHPVPTQCRDEQYAMSNANGMNFNGLPPKPRLPSQITPSPPPRGTGQQKLDEDMFMSVDQANLGNNFMCQSQQEFAYLQRATSMPVQAKSLVQQVIDTQPQPLSAPAMMPLVPGGGMPSASNNDQFVVLDNQVYQIPNYHSNMFPQMDASDLIHHVHHSTGVSQRFATGQMVAGVPGGL